MFNGGALVQRKVNIWTGHVWEFLITFHMKDEQEDRKFIVCFFLSICYFSASQPIGTHIEPLSNIISRTSWMGLLDFDATSGLETGQCANSLNTLICTLDVIHFSETLHSAILQCMPIRPPIQYWIQYCPKGFCMIFVVYPLGKAYWSCFTHLRFHHVPSPAQEAFASREARCGDRGWSMPPTRH